MLDDTTTAPPATGSSSDFDREFLAEVGEAPAPAQPAPAAPAAPAPEPAAPVPSGQPRDEQGRFASPTPPAEPTPVPAEPAPAAPTTPPTTPPAEPPVPETPAPAETYPEATYRADQQDFTIPGSQVGSNGVFIPTPAWTDVQRLLAFGQVHQGSFQRKLSESAQEVQRATRRAEAAEASKAAVFDKLVKMAEDNTLEDWMADFKLNLPVLLAKAEAEGARLQIKQFEEERQAETKRQQEAALGPQMETALERTILHYGTTAGLSVDRMRALYQRLNTPHFRKVLFSQADADDPVLGIRQGDWTIDYGVIEQEVAWAGPGSSGTAPADKVAAAAAQNAKTTGQPVATPPTVGAKAGPAPKPAPPPKKFGSAEEADAFIWGEGFSELAKS